MNRVPLGTQYGLNLLGSSRPTGGLWIFVRELRIDNGSKAPDCADVIEAYEIFGLAQRPRFAFLASRSSRRNSSIN